MSVSSGTVYEELMRIVFNKCKHITPFKYFWDMDNFLQQYKKLKQENPLPAVLVSNRPDLFIVKSSHFEP